MNSKLESAIEAHHKRCAQEEEIVEGVGKMNEGGTGIHIVHGSLQDKQHQALQRKILKILEIQNS